LPRPHCSYLPPRLTNAEIGEFRLEAESETAEQRQFACQRSERRVRDDLCEMGGKGDRCLGPHHLFPGNTGIEIERVQDRPIAPIRAGQEFDCMLCR
jgi:hypothetical protein